MTTPSEACIYSPEHPSKYVDDSGSGPFQWTNGDIALWNATWALMPEIDFLLTDEPKRFTHVHAKLTGALLATLKTRHQSGENTFLEKLKQPPTHHVAQKLIYFAGITGFQVQHDIYTRLGIRDSLKQVARNFVDFTDFKTNK